MASFMKLQVWHEDGVDYWDPIVEQDIFLPRSETLGEHIGVPRTMSTATQRASECASVKGTAIFADRICLNARGPP